MVPISVDVNSFPSFLSYLAGGNCPGKKLHSFLKGLEWQLLVQHGMLPKGRLGAKGDIWGDYLAVRFLVWPPGDCSQRHWPDTCCQRQAMEELVHYGHFASCTFIPEDLSAFPWPQWDCFTQRSQDWGVSPGDWGAHDKPDKTLSYLIKRKVSGTSLVVQWLRLQAPNAGGLGSISGHGTRSHMPQLQNMHATTKTGHSQINK